MYQEVADAVVSIRVYAEDSRGGQGSGFLVDDEHIARTITSLRAGTSTTSALLTLAGGLPPSSAQTCQRPGGPPHRCDPGRDPPLVRRDRTHSRNRVVAIGNPVGLSGSVSAGIVSGVDRTLQSANDFSIADRSRPTRRSTPPAGADRPREGDVVGVITRWRRQRAFAIPRRSPTRRAVAHPDRRLRPPVQGVGLRSVSPRVAEANNLDPGSGVYITRVVRGVRGSDPRERPMTHLAEQFPIRGDEVRQMDDTPTPTRQALGSFPARRPAPARRSTYRSSATAHRKQSNSRSGPDRSRNERRQPNLLSRPRYCVGPHPVRSAATGHEVADAGERMMAAPR